LDELLDHFRVNIVPGLLGDVDCEGCDLSVDRVFFFSNDFENAGDLFLSQSLQALLLENILDEESSHN
jgi:hypothetical protein